MMGRTWKTLKEEAALIKRFFMDRFRIGVSVEQIAEGMNTTRNVVYAIGSGHTHKNVEPYGLPYVGPDGDLYYGPDEDSY